MLESATSEVKVDRFLASSAQTPNPTRAPARTTDSPHISGVVENPTEDVLGGAGSGKGVLPGQTAVVNNHVHIFGQFWLKYNIKFANRALARAESDPRKFKFQFWIDLGFLSPLESFQVRRVQIELRKWILVKSGTKIACKQFSLREGKLYRQAAISV